MKIIIASLASALVTTVALSYDFHHPNLRDASNDVVNAIHHLEQAQALNKGVEFGGHVEKAMNSLRYAQEELAEGDKYNDAHHR